MMAERIAALLGLCCALINESTLAAGIESFLVSVSAFWAEQTAVLNRKDEIIRISANENLVKSAEIFCIKSANLFFGRGGSVDRDVHLPENIVEFIQRVVLDIDLSAAIAPMP